MSEIFNNEFLFDPPQIIRQRGVPLSRMDVSGYGASIFSDWLNPKAAIAETSQAKFDVYVGRCASEIVQVKTIMYPGAIKVVRTITLFRSNTGYCYRFDSGWTGDGFSILPITFTSRRPVAKDAGYPIHPGVCGGYFEVKNIRETDKILPFIGDDMVFPHDQDIIDMNGQEIPNDGRAFHYHLQQVYFDAEVEIENPVSGFVSKEMEGQPTKKVVPSKGILGFVQLAPRGLPWSPATFNALLARQGGSIGGPIDCVVDIGGSGQQMRLNRFDVAGSLRSRWREPGVRRRGLRSVLLPAMARGAWDTSVGQEK